MREQVAQAVTLGVVSPPSEEQWAMILCRQPLARIFAGAGSASRPPWSCGWCSCSATWASSRSG